MDERTKRSYPATWLDGPAGMFASVIALLCVVGLIVAAVMGVAWHLHKGGM
jgi:hypothetical protein